LGAGAAALLVEFRHGCGQHIGTAACPVCGKLATGRRHADRKITMAWAGGEGYTGGNPLTNHGFDEE